MAQNEYKPLSFNGESLTTPKLNQLSNNVQYIFERSPKLRYAIDGLTRDSGLKVLAGKAYYAPDTSKNYCYKQIYFGSFFTAGCKPVVSIGHEAVAGAQHRSRVTMQGYVGNGLDHTGFTAVISGEAYQYQSEGGWIHYVAIGY